MSFFFSRPNRISPTSYAITQRGVIVADHIFVTRYEAVLCEGSRSDPSHRKLPSQSLGAELGEFPLGSNIAFPIPGQLGKRLRDLQSHPIPLPDQIMQKWLMRLRRYSRCAMAAEDANKSNRHQPSRSLDYILKGKVYVEELPPDIEPIRRFLEKYSGIRGKDVDEHIHQIRDRLWEIYPYVCIGHFRFLSLKFTLDPRYQVALSRLLAPDSKATLLDVGCCVGQVLRQLAFDGVDSSRLYGTDLEPRFLEAGYDLFKDRDKFKATFVAGDMLNQCDEDNGGNRSLEVFDGKMNIIHATSFFHLFTWENQVRAARRMVRFLDPNDSYVMIFGRQVGTTTPGDREGARGSKRFLHNATSWQELWDEVGKLTGTSWRTVVNEIEEPDMHPDGNTDGTLRRIRFGIFRA
ncbi:hypothetical protein M434DRAFT_402129 [Hypoxylon sp. CO27-5]|nr:hypothetical protein M434DRAFT_402129 [Hypoxylon sp. CO27-5]